MEKAAAQAVEDKEKALENARKVSSWQNNPCSYLLHTRRDQLQTGC